MTTIYGQNVQYVPKTARLNVNYRIVLLLGGGQLIYVVLDNYCLKGKIMWCHTHIHTFPAALQLRQANHKHSC